MNKKTVALVVIFALCLAPAAFAASPWTSGESYSDKVKGKLEFGLKNFLGGWTEIITRPAEAKKNGNCSLKGLGVGIMNAVVYTVGGVIHTATFPIPLDVPLPNNGVSLE